MAILLPESRFITQEYDGADFLKYRFLWLKNAHAHPDTRAGRQVGPGRKFRAYGVGI